MSGSREPRWGLDADHGDRASSSTELAPVRRAAGRGRLRGRVSGARIPVPLLRPSPWRPPPRQPRGRVRGRRPPAWRSCALHPLSKARACLPGAGRGARAPRARHPPRPGAVVNPGGGARLALLCVSEGPTGMLRKGFPSYCFSTVPVHTPHAHPARLMSGDRRGGHSLKELTRHSHVR